MPETAIAIPLLRRGRLHLDPGLRGLPPGTAQSGPVVTATIQAIVAQLPGRGGPLGGAPAAALLRRGAAA